MTKFYDLCFFAGDCTDAVSSGRRFSLCSFFSFFSECLMWLVLTAAVAGVEVAEVVVAVVLVLCFSETVPEDFPRALRAACYRTARDLCH